MTKTPLLGKTLSELKAIVQDLGMPKFTAGQIASWLYDKKVGSIEEMTNLSLKNRERLMENYEVGGQCTGACDAFSRRNSEVPVLHARR